SIRVPGDKATHPLSYLKLTPVWIEKEGYAISYAPMLPRWDITGIARETVYLQDSLGNSQILSEELPGFDGLNSPVLPANMFAAPSASPGAPDVNTFSEWTGVIQRDANAEDDAISVLEVLRTTWTGFTWIAGNVKEVFSFATATVKSAYRVEKLDQLPKGHWARSLKYKKATAGISTVTGVISIVTNGHELWKAAKEGEWVEVGYYALKTAAAGAETAPDMVEIAEMTLGYSGKATKLGALSAKKAQVGLAIAVGVIEVTYDFYKLATTDDPILQQAYLEDVGANILDTGLSVAAVFCPEVLVIQVVWTVEVEVYSLIFGEDFAYEVARSPGKAAVFLWEYETGVPSQFAQEAYEEAEEGLRKEISNCNTLQALGYICVFVDPGL
ncbi:hypothetical protein DRJ27_04640, partial [Candidatus Acetothermia bacterium]